MFVKNCWYCAGRDYAVRQGKNALLARRLADERPHGNKVDIKHAAGPNKLVWVLDKFLREEAAPETQRQSAA